MTEERFNAFEQELRERGYHETNHPLCGENCDKYWYKAFGESQFEEDRSNYQVFFLVYDFRKFQSWDKNLKPFGVQPVVMYSRTTKERIDINLGLGVRTIEDVENFAERFAEWFGPVYEPDYFYGYDNPKETDENEE